MNLGAQLTAAVAAAQDLGALLRILRQFYDVAERRDAQVKAALPRQPDCRAGCAFCCHLPVAASAAEVFFVATFICERLDVQQYRALLERLRAHAEMTLGKNPQQQAELRIPCPLLHEANCSIHPARPFACRKFHSFDVAACEYSSEHPEDTAKGPPQSPQILATWKELTSFSDRAFADAGYDSTGYELASALLEALTDPDASKRFIARQPTFLKAKQFWGGSRGSVTTLL